MFILVFRGKTCSYYLERINVSKWCILEVNVFFEVARFFEKIMEVNSII